MMRRTRPALAIGWLATGLWLSTPVHAATYFVDNTNPRASDDNPGNPGLPWLTIQKAADVMLPGDEVIVNAGTYTELRRGLPNTQVAGIKPQYSGTPELPIVYRASGSVTIDQRNAGTGFYIQQRNHIRIEGFEITNVRIAGIWTTVDGQTDISITNNHIHSVRGGGENDPGDADNIGAVKLDGCMNCEVRGNTLHDIVLESGVPSNAAGIHSFDMENALIASNLIYDVHDGIFHKRSTGSTGAIIVDNEIRDVEWAVYQSVGGAGDPAHVSQIVRGNRIVNCAEGVRATVDETGSPSTGLIVESNHIQCATGILLRGMSNARIRDNIIQSTGPSVVTVSGLRDATIEVSDFNHFSPQFTVILQRFDRVREREIGRLSEWQDATGLDTQSLVGDVAFRAAENGQSWLALESPDRGTGYDGRDIGPHPDGDDRILGPESLRPLPPPEVSARFE